MTVPFVDLKAQYRTIKPEIDAAIEEIVSNTAFIGGSAVTKFEEAFAAYNDMPHCVACANGTDAIEIALRALGVGPGDEVIVPSFTFYASAEAIPPTGATPVFCDVDPDTFCVTADTVKAVMTPRTKAVVAVHHRGQLSVYLRLCGVPLPAMYGPSADLPL